MQPLWNFSPIFSTYLFSYSSCSWGNPQNFNLHNTQDRQIPGILTCQFSHLLKDETKANIAKIRGNCGFLNKHTAICCVLKASVAVPGCCWRCHWSVPRAGQSVALLGWHSEKRSSTFCRPQLDASYQPSSWQGAQLQSSRSKFKSKIIIINNNYYHCCYHCYYHCYCYYYLI